MKNNILFMCHTNNSQYRKTLKNCSDNFIELNYIEAIQEKGQQNLYIYLENLLKINNINKLFILLDQCDCSLDLDYLQKLKINYSIKIVFIFKSSQNSFEYIDRYYAQIADMNIIDDIPYIEDFFNMLCIPVSVINNYVSTSYNKKQKVDFDLAKICKNNIFSSQLINLSINTYNDYIYNKLQKRTNYIRSINYQEQPFELYIINIMRYLNEKTSQNSNIIKDKKFIFASDIYKIYWCLYKYIQTDDIMELKYLLKLKYFFYLGKIIKLYKTIKKDIDTTTLENINKALFKEYTL